MDKSSMADKIWGRIDLSTNQKLFLIWQLYKEELNSQYPQLHYILAGWKDLNLNEIWCSKVLDCLEEIKQEKRKNENN